MAKQTKNDEHAVLTDIIRLFACVDENSRDRIFRAVHAYFYPTNDSPTPALQHPPQHQGANASREPSFSDKKELSPKLFLLEKQPKTDIERVACLAYYLTHYYDQPHFKTSDISKLNTEAAQAKFSNTAYAVSNATRRGFLVPAVRGYKQIGALGEQFVMGLPDRDKTNDIVNKMKSRRGRKSKKNMKKGS